MTRAHQKHFHAFLTGVLVEWRFNPPKASHQGGVWERMVCTIRQVLTGVMEQVSRLTDEVLDTLFCEVENQVNGRPITKVSDDVNDLEALTPNHFTTFTIQYCFSVRGGP